MIEMKAVTKKYGDFTAVENLTLTADDCSVLGLAGCNGAGKTTLLKVCAGVYKADAGEVLLDGANVFDNDFEKKKLFFLPDDMWFPQNATVKSAAKFYAGYYPHFDVSVFKGICDLFGLNPLNKIHSLSKGMARQASLAIAFAARPKYLLIDETFDGLDPQKKELLRKIMLEYINETEASVLITSHDLPEIAGLCDHVALMNGKKIILDCAAADVSDHFRRAVLTFETPVDAALFENINYKKLKLSGKNAVLLIIGDIAAEEEKLKALGAKTIETEYLTLEEVFIEEMEGEHNEEKIKRIFSKEHQ